jgi:hypothetical protein
LDWSCLSCCAFNKHSYSQSVINTNVVHHFSMTDKLTLGGTYRTNWDNGTARIIGLDDLEVFYDGYWPHDNSWTFSGNFKKKCYFYRTSRQVFEEKSVQQDILPLTTEEKQAFRPDLPMRLGRSKALSWNDFKVSDLKELPDNDFLQQRLQADKIVLLPYGIKGGLKKGTIVTADNGTYLDCEELIWKAKRIQESVNNETSKGIGIYRIGFETRLPSFYIGQYIDSAGIMTE